MGLDTQVLPSLLGSDLASPAVRSWGVSQEEVSQWVNTVLSQEFLDRGLKSRLVSVLWGKKVVCGKWRGRKGCKWNGTMKGKVLEFVGEFREI